MHVKQNLLKKVTRKSKEPFLGGFLSEAEEYDLGLKRICRFKALTSTLLLLFAKGGHSLATNIVDITVVKADEITVILFVSRDAGL